MDWKMPTSKMRAQFWELVTLTQVAMVMSVTFANMAGGRVTLAELALARVSAFPTFPVAKV